MDELSNMNIAMYEMCMKDLELAQNAGQSGYPQVISLYQSMKDILDDDTDIQIQKLISELNNIKSN